jgi:hypothetical protein
LVGPELELESERGEKNKNIIIIKNISGEETEGGKDEEMGDEEEGRKEGSPLERENCCVCFSISFCVVYIRLSLSAVGSLAKRRPNEQGQTQLTPSVSDRYDCVCVCVSRPI